MEDNELKPLFQETGSLYSRCGAVTSDIENLEENAEENETKLVAPQAAPRKYEIIYLNVLRNVYWHLAGAYGLYLCFTSAKWLTIIYYYFVFLLAQLGVNAGAHRLWSHKSYKVKLPIEIMLMLFNCVAFQNAIFYWVRDHRLHHKYSDTDADPHNATRGFFYSHIGWLVVKKHPEVKKRGKTIDLSDLYNNPVIMFQKKYAAPLFIMFCFVLPTIIPIYLWNETFSNAWNINILRYATNLNITFLVNSFAHMFGCKTYDKNIKPVQNIFVSLVGLGEGFHNYHHTFPWDYKTAELGNNKLNFTAKFIDFLASIGWAYDLKTVSEDIVLKRTKRTGDGTDLWGRIINKEATTADIENMEENTEENETKLVAPQAAPRKYEIIYFNILTFAYWHLAGAYGLYLCFTSAKWLTMTYYYFVFLFAQLGLSAGAHRLWSHKSYKLKLPMEIILMLFNCMAFQNAIFYWVRDHRLHHKYSDTDADPHNATRGFFYSHIGWLFVKKHPEVKKCGKKIDLSDVYNNPVLMFQKRYAAPMFTFFCFILPTSIPFFLWDETLNNAWHINILRYATNLHITFLVNSFAHMYGCKSYDKNIKSVQNITVSLVGLGEGFHNYHHTFPWDYRSAELGNDKLNLTTKFIDFLVSIGWAYDLKTVSEDIVLKRKKRTGDGTDLWGRLDKTLVDEDNNFEELKLKNV